jgi:hypothetical protein
LTSLILDSHADAEQMLKVAGQNTGLVQLEFHRSHAQPPFMTGHQRTLLSTCTSLTQLHIAGFHIDGQALDLLLTHCTSITDLTLGRITLDSSRADRQCSWRKLTLRGSFDTTLLQLTYLPLRAVQELWDPFVNTGTLCLPPPDVVPTTQLPSLLRQAATNLATCPAWIRTPPSQIRLSWGKGHELGAEQRVQLFKALVPLGVGHVTEMVISLEEQLELGCMEVQALVSSIGDSLQTLRLANCTLLGTFWKALAQHLPHLSYLDLYSNVATSVIDITVYLTLQSSSSTQPMRLEVDQGVLDAQSRLQLEQHISSWQLELQGITVLFEAPIDEEEDEEKEEEEEEEEDDDEEDDM